MGFGGERHSARLPIEFGERNYYKFEVHGSDTPIKGLTGAQKASGVAHLFSVPFDIIVSPALKDEYVTSDQSTGATIILYPPFLGVGSKSAAQPQIDLGTVPYKKGTLPPNSDSLRVKLPGISGQLGIPMDSMRIDIFPDAGDKYAITIFERLLGLTRWFTYQWWIKRDNRPFRDYLRDSFDINSVSERVSGVTSTLVSFGLLGHEKPLDEVLFRRIGTSFSLGRHIPMYIDLHLDAIYFHAVGDLRRSVLEEGIACEVLLGEAVSTGLNNGAFRASTKKVFAGNNFMQHLNIASREVDRSFKTEFPEEYEWLHRLWIARGHVAHGKVPVIPLNQGSKELEASEMLSILDAVTGFIAWAQDAFAISY